MRWRAGLLLPPGAVAVLWACGSFESSPAPLPADASTVDEAAPPTLLPDAGADAPFARGCRHDQPFGVPAPLDPSVNTAAYSEVTARFAADLLTLYFARIGKMPDGGNLRDLFVARRPSMDAPFGAPVSLGVLNTTSLEFAPSLGRDEAEIFFTSDRTWDGGGGRDLWTASLSGGVFGTPTPAEKLDTSLEESTPYLVRSGTVLYFDRGGKDAGTGDIYVSYRKGTGFGDPVLVQGGINQPTTEEADAVVTPDELVIYFRRNPPGSNDGDIYRAARADRSGPFGASEAVKEFQAFGISKSPTWVSADDCTLLLSARFEPAGGDIYIARRPQ